MGEMHILKEKKIQKEKEMCVSCPLIAGRLF
jgi:hypothetical protein